MNKSWIYLIFVLFTLESFGQSHALRGNITDETNMPVIGATVVEMDENNRTIGGTITDVNGNYVLKLTSLNCRVQFSFIGYESKIEEVKGRSNIDIQLLPSSEVIEDIVVIGKGSTSSLTGISDQYRTGSIAKMEMITAQGEALNDVSDALQGQIAGLDIVSSGSPGESSSIVIRGLSTLGDATPLIVIDGIAQQAVSDFDFSSADVEDLSALLSVPTQDIKSVNVLKDATECAMWGSRGANGVIEIVTHQGRKGKTRFTYSFKNTMNESPDQIPMLNGDEYIMMQQEQMFNRYGLVDIPDEIAYNPEYVDFYNYSQNTNWYDEISKNGFTREHGLKVDGGGDKTNYYVSLNLSNQEGQIINESLDRISARVNLFYNISDNIKLTTRFTYLNSETGGNWKQSNANTVTSMAYKKAPNMSVYDYDASGNSTGEYFNPVTNYQGDGITYFNPVAVVNSSKNDSYINQLSSDFILRLRVTDHLVFTETVSILNKGTKASIYLPYYAIGAAWNNSSNNLAQEGNSVISAITTRSVLTFKPERRAGHTFESSVMWETYQSKSKSMVTASKMNMSTWIQDPAANAIVKSISSSDSKVTDVGLLGKVAYDYKEKYIVSGTLRAEASSRFGNNNRWGFFPSVGVKWRMKNEEFLQNLRFLGRSDLSLNWGRAGKIGSLGAYSRHGIYNDGGMYMNDVSIVPTQPELENLKWETKDEISTALELGFLKRNKLSLILEYYSKKTYDVAWKNYPIPTTSGYTKLTSFNGGEIRNVGYEVTANLRDAIKVNDFSLNLRFNMLQTRNWFNDLPDNQALEQNGTTLQNLKYPLKTQLGSPIGSFFGLRYLGVYANDEDAVAHNADGSIKRDANGDPVYMVFNNSASNQFEGGDAIYEDINHDGSIDMNDAVWLGDSNPKLTGGFGVTAKYGNTKSNWGQVQLSAQFVYRYKFNVINQVAMDAESMNNRNNQSKATLYRWRRQGDNFEGIIPRAYQGHTFNSLGSDRYVEDVSYVKLNSLALTYRMGKGLKDRLRIDDCVVSLNARKLYTWTEYSGLNPEISQSMSDQFWVAKDSGKTTPPRTYSLTVTLTL